MQGFAGKVAVVTGAGSGIGQALAVELGRSGAKVAISDVDIEGLGQTEEQLKAIGTPVKAEAMAVVMVTPAEGPSLGMAPSGK